MTRPCDRKKGEHDKERAEKQCLAFYYSTFSQGGSNKTKEQQQDQNRAHQLCHPGRVCGDGSNNKDRKS